MELGSPPKSSPTSALGGSSPKSQHDIIVQKAVKAIQQQDAAHASELERMALEHAEALEHAAMGHDTVLEAAQEAIQMEHSEEIEALEQQHADAIRELVGKTDAERERAVEAAVSQAQDALEEKVRAAAPHAPLNCLAHRHNILSPLTGRGPSFVAVVRCLSCTLLRRAGGAHPVAGAAAAVTAGGERGAQSKRAGAGGGERGSRQHAGVRVGTRRRHAGASRSRPNTH
jgi:hypothetical protein